MKNLTILFIISASFLVNLNAQERINEVLPKEFILKSQKLISAIGWKKNRTTGKWIENKNLIFDEKRKNTIHSKDDQNFKNIQFSKIKFNDTQYYIFLYEHLNGLETVRGNSIYGKGKVTYFFVMTEEQYIKLKANIESKSGENIIVPSKSFGEMNNLDVSLGGRYLYTDENLIFNIIEEIKRPMFYNQQMVLNSQIIEGDEIVRFLLPSATRGNFEEWRGDYNLRIAIEYFEVKLSEFKRILID